MHEITHHISQCRAVGKWNSREENSFYSCQVYLLKIKINFVSRE